MNAPTMDLGLREKHEQAEQRCAEAAEAEQAAYLHWQEAYGAYELARDEASAALRAWVQALVP
ncbi:MAG: hypothetical protein JO272_03945 [Pseudonocardiales bacterium]|nr:hypothetical protein [Pseudonocardiales bacterium]